MVPSRGTSVLLHLAAVQHERGPRTSTIRKQVALYFRGHKEVNGSATHFPGSSLPGPPFFTTVTQLEPHNLDLATVATTPERQAIVGLAQPTPKVGRLRQLEFQMRWTKLTFLFLNIVFKKRHYQVSWKCQKPLHKHH